MNYKTVVSKIERIEAGYKVTWADILNGIYAIIVVIIFKLLTI